MKMVMMFCVSQNPVIMTSTCKRLRPLGPEMRSVSGVFSRLLSTSVSQISDSETMKM